MKWREEKFRGYYICDTPIGQLTIDEVSDEPKYQVALDMFELIEETKTLSAAKEVARNFIQNKLNELKEFLNENNKRMV